MNNLSKIISDLKSKTELNPDTYDGSYELVQSVARHINSGIVNYV